MIELPPSAVVAMERDLGLRGSFFHFVEMAWPHIDPMPFVDNWHIRIICAVLERVFRRELRKVVIDIPPGLSKSTLVCVLWPVWCWMRDSTQAFLGTSFDADLTRRDAGKSLKLIQSDWFRERWGDRSPPPEEGEKDHRVFVEIGAAEGEYENTNGGWRFATSTGGKATGRHPDIKIIDDPTKPQTVNAGTLRESEKYWRETLSTRQRDANTSCTVLIMQRLHSKDLAGIFEKEGGWHFVVLPMRFAAASDNWTPYPDDPRTTPGELLCPARYDETAVRQLEKDLGSRGAAAQLGQRPSPEGGAIFKRQWLRWYDPATMTIANPDGSTRPVPLFSRRLQTWDLAFKETTESSFVAGQTWGVAGADIFGLDGFLERIEFTESIKAILAMRERNPLATGILIEDKANGPAVMSVLRKSVSGIIPVEPSGGKEARANAASPIVEAGNVYLPFGRKWAEDLADSLSGFPSWDWDDDVDAFTQLALHVQRKGIDYANAMSALGRLGRSL